MVDLSPTGLGVYVRRLRRDVHGSPEQAATMAADHRVSHVHIMGYWAEYDGDGRSVAITHNRDRIAAYADSFASRGIVVRLWAYPAAGLESSVVGALAELTDLCDGTISGYLLDPELMYRESMLRSLRRRGRDIPSADMSAELLMLSMLDIMTEEHDIGVTSYGVPPKDLPMEIFGRYGWQSPQIYNMSRTMIRRSIARWISTIETPDKQPMVPAVQAYGDHDREMLPPWLDMMTDVWIEETGSPPVGIDTWSWLSIDSSEWRHLEDYAESMEW